ncbi:MAG: LCP family protein [Ruminococcus flavefaciens]|nr:LCP family protein [Ruminococcus flavefaciens]MCM1230535.1 LCP family protein [Ruminococcus flavefaciens]
MSDRKKSNNTDNQDTRTTYIPPEVREQYKQSVQRPQRPSPPQNPQSYNPQHQQYQPPPYQNPQQYQQQQQYPNQPYNPYQQYQQPQQYQQYQNPQPYQNPPQYQPQQQYQPYQPQRPPKKKPQKKRTSAPKKKKKSGFSRFIGRFIAILFIILLLLFGIYSCTVYKLIGKMDYSETGSRTRTDYALSESYVKSVLLIGTDGRSNEERGRSDTMMLLSLNSRADTINLTSFMRDCYVEIPGYGWDKLNSAYSYGGAELLMDTIEHNFGVKIDDYVSVNFVSFANIIDSVGGIDIDVSDAEAQEINTILQAEVNEIMGDDTFADLLTGGGKLHLNGKQALSYARIRYVGNADFERTERQRRVMELAVNKIKTFVPSAISNISDSVMPNVTTNMTSQELYLLSLRVPLLVGYETKQLQIPAENTYYGDYREGSGDSLIVDFDSNYNIIKENVFSE